MDNQENNNISIKDLPIYRWHNKEEGQEEYACFAKQFKLSFKHLRYLLEPGGVQRRLGSHPGPAPALAAARRDWREDTICYEGTVAKVEERFAAALSALELCFAFATSPRHIIDAGPWATSAWRDHLMSWPCHGLKESSQVLRNLENSRLVGKHFISLMLYNGNF